MECYVFILSLSLSLVSTLYVASLDVSAANIYCLSRNIDESKRKRLRPGKVSPYRPVPAHISRPPYVNSRKPPGIASEPEVHDEKGIEGMRASGRLAAQVLQHAGTLVKVALWFSLSYMLFSFITSFKFDLHMSVHPSFFLVYFICLKWRIIGPYKLKLSDLSVCFESLWCWSMTIIKLSSIFIPIFYHQFIFKPISLLLKVSSDYSLLLSYVFNILCIGSQALQQMISTKQFTKWLLTMELILHPLVMVGFQRVYAHRWTNAFAMEFQIHVYSRFFVIKKLNSSLWC